MRGARAQSGGIGVGADLRVSELRSADDWAQALATAARAAGENDFGAALRKALGALCPRSPGRRAIDDTMELDEMRLLVGEGQSVEEAARAVAVTRQNHSPVSATKRLAKKYRAQEENSGN